MDHTNDVSAAVHTPGRFFYAYRQMLPFVLRHPATWLLTVLWLASWLFLFMKGQPVLIGLPLTILNLLLVLLAIPLTQGILPAPISGQLSTMLRWRLWLQVVLLFCSVGLITLTTLLGNLHLLPSLLLPFYTVTQTDANVPLAIFIALFFEAGLPFFLAFLLGMNWQELGLQRGYHVWRTTALFSFPTIIFLFVVVIEGKMVLTTLIIRLVILLLAAGLPEEVGFRGILMTRLVRLLGTGWGLALAALLFGLFHFGADIARSGSTNILVVFATAMYGQMFGGFAFAFLFLRTRSLIPGIIVHTLSDSIAGLI